MREKNLIDKKDLVECLMEHFKYPWPFDDLLNQISEIPVVKEKYTWIPVDKSVPAEWKKVWVTIRYPSGFLNTEEGKWEGSFKYKNGREIKYPVIAWKPYYAPEPYKEEET